MAKVSAMPAVTAGDVVDADEFYILDGGVSKKISAVNLAQISQITSRYVAQSTLTTDGDVLTRASGSPARITRADLAQDTAFSSRYAPLGTVFVEAERFTIGSGATKGQIGSPTESSIGVLLFDASAQEWATCTWFAPTNWATYDIHVWWTNAGAGSGDVVWYATTHSFGDTESSNADTNVPGAYPATITAPAQYVAKRSKLNSSAIACTAGEIQKLWLYREGPDGNDTLGNDAAVYGVEFVRVS